MNPSPTPCWVTLVFAYAVCMHFTPGRPSLNTTSDKVFYISDLLVLFPLLLFACLPPPEGSPFTSDLWLSGRLSESGDFRLRPLAPFRPASLIAKAQNKGGGQRVNKKFTQSVSKSALSKFRSVYEGSGEVYTRAPRDDRLSTLNVSELAGWVAGLTFVTLSYVTLFPFFTLVSSYFTENSEHHLVSFPDLLPRSPCSSPPRTICSADPARSITNLLQVFRFGSSEHLTQRSPPSHSSRLHPESIQRLLPCLLNS